MFSKTGWLSFMLGKIRLLGTVLSLPYSLSHSSAFLWRLLFVHTSSMDSQPYSLRSHPDQFANAAVVWESSRDLHFEHRSSCKITNLILCVFDIPGGQRILSSGPLVHFIYWFLMQKVPSPKYTTESHSPLLFENSLMSGNVQFFVTHLLTI